jgi:hypothetical protein
VNLLFLVEGEVDEKKVYRAWMQHLFPSWTFVQTPEQMTTNTYRIVAGGGYPQIFNRLGNCLADMQNYKNVAHFFFCIDSEEYSYSDRFNEVKTKLDSLKTLYSIDYTKTEIHIIIQNCCFETWCLGNTDIPNQYNQQLKPKNNKTFSDYQAYYDVLSCDPESMTCCPPHHPFTTNAQFHKKYLRTLLKEYGLRNSPETFGDVKYLDALRERCKLTKDIASFKILLDTLSNI